jgi:hypothetical protein
LEAKTIDSMSLPDARLEAQKIVFGPLLFQAARLLRDFGILRALRQARSGLTLEELTAKVDASRYGVLVLVEAGLAAGLVRTEEARYFVTATGACLLSDELTGVNMDFVQNCCFQAMYHLEDSIRSEKPVGLQSTFGNWDTIYPALSQLPPAARDSWFKWDHYYSDAAFPQALPLVFARRPASLLDVGGNTGKWAIQCASYSAEVAVTILDHPGQVSVARRNIEERGLQQRISCRSIDLLDHSQPFPEGFDAIWMSQFLVCFAEKDVARLLERRRAGSTSSTPSGTGRSTRRRHSPCRRARCTSPASRMATAACTRLPTSPPCSRPRGSRSKAPATSWASARLCWSAESAEKLPAEGSGAL